MTLLALLAVLFSMVAVPEAGAAPKPPRKVWTPPKTALHTTRSVEAKPGAARGVATAPRRPGGVEKIWKPAPRRALKTGSATVALPGVPAAGAGGRKSAGSTGRSSAAGTGTDEGGALPAGGLPVTLTDLGTPGPTRADSGTKSVSKPGSQGGSKAATGAAAAGSGSAPAEVRVEVHTPAASRAAGAASPLISLTDPAAGTTGGRQLKVSLDVAALQGTGAWSDRARLVRLPACALTTPGRPECRERTPVASVLDARSGRLTAEVTLPATTGPAPKARAAGSAAAAPALVSAPATVLAAEPAPAGSGGNFAASPLSPSMSWSAGSNAGNFTYGYTFDLPTSLGGAAPGVQLGYDSSGVDGMTSANNSQSSWIGDGWNYHPGSITRTYKPCLSGGIDMSGDQCWAGQSLGLSLAGHSGQLVKDDTTGTLRLQGDDGTKITPLTGLPNGAWNGEGFKVTTTDGTQYYFGAGRLPGGDGTDPASESVNTAPVYHPKAGDPCWSAGAGKASWCQMAWQWNLDYIVDLHGNLITYTYEREGNHYARGGGQNNGNGSLTAYTRYSSLKKIGYGQRLPEQTAAKGALNPAVQMEFTTSERCIPTAQFDCAPNRRTLANQAYWPDTPLDQACGATGTCAVYGPTFWTSKRLTKVETRILTGGSYRTVDSWALNQVFSDPQDGTNSPTLWLESIRRTGSNGQNPVTLPAVKFTAAQKPNRVDGLVPAAPQFNRPRMSEITTETGGRVSIGYHPVECSRVNGRMPTSPQSNTMACQPVKWVTPGSPPDAAPVDDWFHKYLVSSITRESQVTSGAAQTTRYEYGGGAAWHRNDSEFADDKTRTWDNFRGYQTVTTLGGNGADGPRSKSVATFLRGMGGQVADTWGGTITDEEEFAGFVRESRTFESEAPGAQVVSGELSTPWRSDPTATYTPPGGLPKIHARYVNTAQVKERARLANGEWRTTQRDVTYDQAHAGRVLTVDVLGDVTRPEQRQCTSTSYATGADSHLMEFPYRVLTLAGACGQTPVKSNTIADTQTLYDGQPLGTVGTRALQTSSRVLAAYETDGSPRYRTTVTAEFDKYGRQTATTDPNSTDATHPGGARTVTAYVPAEGALPTAVEVTNPMGWKSVTTLDPGRARPTRAVDENGHATDESYDALGRLTEVWQNGRDRATQSPNRKFTYALNGAAGPAVITSESLREDGSYARSIQIHDGFGRVRQTQSMPSYGSVGRLISDAVLDSQGRQVQSTPSYFNDDSGPTAVVFTPQDAQIPAQSWNEYDALGRVTVSKAVSYGQEQWRTTTAYRGADRIDVTPPQGGYATTTITDARGATTEVRQYKSGTPEGAYDSTWYAYDTSGRATLRKDSSGNEWRYGYDLLGQQTGNSDPDAGDTTTSYDAGGRVTTATDARGKSTSFTYDLLGRKTAAYTGTSTTDPAKKILEWSYDGLKKGKPDSSTRYSGGAAYRSAVTGYDKGYRPTGAAVTIPSVEQELAGTYTSKITYTAVLGLPKTTTLPSVAGLDPEKITNSYDVDGNFLTSSGEYDLVSDVRYDAFGRPTRTTVGPWGKQVVSTQLYDAGTGRVVQSTLDKQTAEATHVGLTSYTYDKAGSLTSVKDVQDGTAVDLQCFRYDYLGRLTSAWTDKGGTSTAPAPSVGGIGGCTDPTEPTAVNAGARVGGPAPYWQSYAYDLTGNRTKVVRHDVTGATAKDQTVDQTFGTGRNTPSTDPTTGGGTGGPHALKTSKTTVGAAVKQATYTYDASGNTTSITDTGGTKRLNWNDQGKIESVTDTAASGATSYVYDASGGQLIRRTPGRVTLFLGADEITLETSSGAVTDTRTYPAPGGLSVARTVVAGASKLYYQAADPHGTNGVQFEADSLLSTRRPSDPFGNGRGAQPGPGVWAGGKGFVGGSIEGTGFTTLGARQYDPATGRFLSVDPLFMEGDPQSWNGYAYANNNPINGSDPDGTCMLMDDGGPCVGKVAPAPPSGGGGGGGPAPTAKGSTPATQQATSDRAAADRNAAAALQKQQAADEALAKAKQQREELMSQIVDVVGDLIGFNDARDCFTKGDVMGCVNTALNFVPWSKVFKAVKVGIRALKLWREGEKAYDAMRVAQRAAREAEDAVAMTRKTASEAADAEAAAMQAEKQAADQAAESADVPTSCPLKHSFPAGTAVQLADGTTKPIEQVKEGDRVLATDPQTGATRAETVEKLIVTPDDKEFTDVTVQEGAAPAATLTTTWHHPFWNTTTARWTDASELAPGQALRTPSGTKAVITAIRNYRDAVVTYDLTVTNLHTYYVLAARIPLLVHNQECGGDDGIAVVHGHQGEGTNVHFTVEVMDSAGDITHSELVPNVGKTKTAIREYRGRAGTMSFTFRLPNAKAARDFQKDVIGTQGAKYDFVTNSCMTHVCDVLRAGGVTDLPNSGTRTVVWAKQGLNSAFRDD
ncbi:polymorphic toxin-type HINT domain-containing protein [Streptomyces sp. NPDC097619]|uniref:polymorphic toxin-type HINT domain-containing protein n=1 Tax=Streptomyces sp. NPDC097619 TaxID=3157228 RepID=UPI00331CBE3A